MQPHKTEKAAGALRDRPADVSVLERRILILSDGRRDGDEIADLLGAQASGALARLLHDGYLSDRPMAASSATIAAVDSGAPAVTPASSRRSIAAAKMYVIDMLMLQRGPEIAATTATIRACRDPDELATHLLRALHRIHAVATTSYSRRVAERLAEIMPEQYLPEVGVFRDALFADSSAAA